MQSELVRRVLSAIVLVFLALGLTWYSPTSFAMLVLLGAILLSWEWGEMTRQPNAETDRTPHLAIDVLTIVYGVMMLALVIALLWRANDYLFLIIALAIITAFYFSTRREKDKNHALWDLGGLLYIGLPLIALVMLRQNFMEGLWLILFLFVTVWSVDIGAYFFGRSIGGPKLAPVISPKKTWSGFIGGVVTGAVLALVFSLSYGELKVSGGLLFVIALILGITAQIGDLLESVIKRHFGIKDSSQLIPGHGGLFDRVDGLILASLVLLIIRLLMGGPLWQ